MGTLDALSLFWMSNSCKVEMRGQDVEGGGDEGQLDRWSRCLEGLLLAAPHRLLLPDARQLSCGARVGQVHICPAHLHQVCGRA